MCICEICGYVLLVVLCCSSASRAEYNRFDFGPGKVAPGYKQVLAETAYSKELGYGFETGCACHLFDRKQRRRAAKRSLHQRQALLFFSGLPEGNYAVLVTLGDSKATLRQPSKLNSQLDAGTSGDDRAASLYTRTFN